MTLFERSEEQFIEQYIYGKKQRISRNMQYGSMMAEGLEAEEATGDPLLDLMMAKLPKFERMDRPVEDPRGPEVTFRDGEKARVPVLMNGKEQIPLLALPDTAKEGYEAFKEYKTSVRKWTHKMADDSGQITFYCTAIWLAKGFIPNDIELVNIQVDYDNEGRLYPTTDIWRFPTKRTMVDVIKMTKRIKENWEGIKQLCEQELIF